MNSFVFSLLLIASLLLINFRSSLCADKVEYTNCSQPITCGTVKNIAYPFWGATRAQYCGVTGFEVTCEDDLPLITMNDIKFIILETDTTATTPTVKVARQDYWGTICPSKYVDTSLDNTLFSYSSGLLNVSIYYGCPSSSTLGPTVVPTVSKVCSNNDTVSYLTQTKSSQISPDPVTAGFCKNEVLIPVLQSASAALDSNTTDIVTAIDSGFNLDVVNADTSLCNNCEASGGVCGQTVTTGAFMCYCSNSSSTKICDSTSAGILNCPVYCYAYNNL